MAEDSAEAVRRGDIILHSQQVIPSRLRVGRGSHLSPHLPTRQVDPTKAVQIDVFA